MSFAIPDSIKALYGGTGPYASVYLDITRANEHGADEVALRWRQLRDQLTTSGADPATVDALSAAAGAHTEIGGARGQVLVAAAGQVLFDRSLARPPARSLAYWAPLPHVFDYLASRGPAIACVLVLADRAGAEVMAYTADQTADTLPPAIDESVSGSRPYPLHETGRDEWDERHFQNRVQNSWRTNAADVAAEVGQAAKAVAAQLVLLAGDPRARSMLRDDLPGVLAPPVRVVDLDAGGRGHGPSSEALTAAVRDAVLREHWRRRHEVLTHLADNVGRGQFAVTGVEGVVGALQRAQADTVVVCDDPSSPFTAWVGPEPLQLALREQELRDLGVEQPQLDRFDAALLRAAAGSDAGLLVTPNAHEFIRGGVGALLRFAAADTPEP
jgi:hypothetical protein